MRLWMPLDFLILSEVITTMTSADLLRVFVFTGVILLIPLLAMQFTDEVDWQIGDFLIGGLLIFGFGLLIHWAIKLPVNDEPLGIAGHEEVESLIGAFRAIPSVLCCCS